MSSSLKLTTCEGNKAFYLLPSNLLDSRTSSSPHKSETISAVAQSSFEHLQTYRPQPSQTSSQRTPPPPYAYTPPPPYGYIPPPPYEISPPPYEIPHDKPPPSYDYSPNPLISSEQAHQANPSLAALPPTNHMLQYQFQIIYPPYFIYVKPYHAPALHPRQRTNHHPQQPYQVQPTPQASQAHPSLAALPYTPEHSISPAHGKSEHLPNRVALSEPLYNALIEKKGNLTDLRVVDRKIEPLIQKAYEARYNPEKFKEFFNEIKQLVYSNKKILCPYFCPENTEDLEIFLSELSTKIKSVYTSSESKPEKYSNKDHICFSQYGNPTKFEKIFQRNAPKCNLTSLFCSNAHEAASMTPQRRAEYKLYKCKKKVNRVTTYHEIVDGEEIYFETVNKVTIYPKSNGCKYQGCCGRLHKDEEDNDFNRFIRESINIDGFPVKWTLFKGVCDELRLSAISLTSQEYNEAFNLLT